LEVVGEFGDVRGCGGTIVITATKIGHVELLLMNETTAMWYLKYTIQNTAKYPSKITVLHIPFNSASCTASANYSHSSPES